MISKCYLLSYTLILLLIVVGCKKDTLPPLEINSNAVTLHYNETFQFSITQEDQPIPSTSVKWASSDEMTGNIGPSGLFKAGIIGRTIISGTYGGQTITCEVDVEPRYTFFREPLTIWGSSMQAVKDYEIRSFMESVNYEDRLDYIEDKAHILDLAYIFKENKLNLIHLAFTRSSDIHEQVVNFYKERYIYERTINQGLIFVDREKRLSIRVGVDEFQWPQPTFIEVTYLPYSPRVIW